MRKNNLATLLLCLFSLATFAQKGTFASFSMSGGIGGNLRESNTNNNSGSTVFTYSVDARLGYRFGRNLQLNSGISFLKTGLDNKMEAILPYNLTPYAERFSYTNVYMPLELGYSFRLSEKMRLTPSVTLGISQVFAAKYTVETDYGYQEKLSTAELRKNYIPFTIWAGAALLLEHSLGERLCLFGGYRFNSMLQRFTKPAFTNRSDHQQLFVISGELGIKYRF